MGQVEVDLARRAYAAFNRGDIAGALQHLDPAIEWHMSDRFARAARVFRGHEGVREVFGIFTEALDDFHVVLSALHDAGEQVIAEVRIGGRLRGTAEPAAYDVVQVWTIRNRQAARLDVYATLADAWSATGMTPPAPSSASTSPPETGRANR